MDDYIKPQTLSYNPSNLTAGVVHIGWGNFARAFVGEYLNDVAELGSRDWGFVAVAPSDRQMRDLTTLQKQANIYHLLKRNGTEICTRIGALLGVMVGQYAPAAVVQKLASPTTKLVTLTITQAGYCLDVNRQLEFTPKVREDIENLRAGNDTALTTVPGWVTAGLYKRFQKGMAPFTALSLDNLPRNGRLLASVVKAFAAQMDDTAFLEYVSKEARFPNSVVDRVTPHQKYQDNHAHLLEHYGIEGDAVPVVCEPYRKLYIEDKFVKNTRPPFDKIGDRKARAVFVEDTAPYENRKLRLLNGSHMIIGLVGKLLQIPTVLEATSDPAVRGFWLSFLTQAADSLYPLEVEEFVQDTTERLDNPHMTDQTDRLLASTTSKVAVRLFNEPALKSGGPISWKASAFAVAVWLRYMTGRDESGNPYNLHTNDAGKLEALGLNKEAGIRANLPGLLTKDKTLAASAPMRRYVEDVVLYWNLIRHEGLLSSIQLTFQAATPPRRPAPALQGCPPCAKDLT